MEQIKQQNVDPRLAVFQTVKARFTDDNGETWIVTLHLEEDGHHGLIENEGNVEIMASVDYFRSTGCVRDRYDNDVEVHDSVKDLIEDFCRDFEY